MDKEQINKNKETFLELVKGITREDADLNYLINWLENKSDFFTAPASTKYHCGFEGGLCQHSLNVYNALSKLNKEYGDYSEDTIRIVALFHDISKANFYEVYERNVNTGQKDEKGKDIWIRVPEYKVKEANSRFIFGNHEQNSEFMIRSFIPLEIEESVAILNHHGGMGYDSTQADLTPIYNKYSLACLLHVADMLATYVTEKL